MSASLIRSVHASTSDLVTGLDARRQVGRTATTTLVNPLPSVAFTALSARCPTVRTRPAAADSRMKS